MNILFRHCTDITYVNNDANYYKLIADKGYITSEKITINNKNVKRVFPKRYNSKVKSTENEKKMLKSHRYKIEHVNASLKKFTRINIRKERLSAYFYSFIYIGSLINNINIFNKLNTQKI